MTVHNPLRVAVADLLADPGLIEKFSESVELSGLSTPLADITRAIDVVATLEAIDGESVHVRGSVETDAMVKCRRCLLGSEMSVVAELDEIYRPDHDAIDPELVVENEEFIDLTSPVRDAVRLSLPEFPLCREDCKGLCSDCGADLNEGDCSCDNIEADPRWSSLESLRSKLDAGKPTEP